MRVGGLASLLPLLASPPSTSAFHPQAQLAFSSPQPPSAPLKPSTPLKGRFIHLTDIHPDSYYAQGAPEDYACHFDPKSKKHHGAKGKAKWTNGEDDDREEELELDGEVTLANDRKGRKAGYWGLPVTDCDSPLSLVNATFDWLEHHFKGEVDFVVWTGDNARHDIDDRLPRSLPEIFSLNTYIADRIRRTFGNVPVVASIGNNDIYPHNIMFPGPSKLTTNFLRLWSSHHAFIPEHMQHTFARGGYYSVEAIPGELLLVSVNTMYFFDKNTAVDGCPKVDDDLRAALLPSSLSPLTPSFEEAEAAFRTRLAAHPLSRDLDPGTEQLLWLEQQLLLARQKGMQVWLTGHVPPEKGGWYKGCLGAWAELVVGYGGSVVGQLYGHMNLDHFSFLSTSDFLSSSLSPSSPPSSPLSASLDPWTPSTLSSSLSATLRALYSALPSTPKKREKHAHEYSVVHVSPSVISTYLPSVRVWEYNTTRPRAVEGAGVAPEDDEEDDDEEEEEGWLPSLLRLLPERLQKLKKKKKHHHTPSHSLPYPSTPSSPSRTSTFLTPLSYTQFHIPLEALEAANEAAVDSAGGGNGTQTPEPPEWRIEYTTLAAREVARRLLLSVSSSSARSDPVLKPEYFPASVRALLSSNHSTSPSFSFASRLVPSFFSRPSPSSLVASAAKNPPASTPHRLTRLLRRLRLTPYEVPSTEGLTVGAWMRIATRLVEDGEGGGGGKGKKGKKKKKMGRAWREYEERMVVGSGAKP
ncbi:hypothetical protein JCM5296_003390 [Sporobolomyces johnsonii]